MRGEGEGRGQQSRWRISKKWTYSGEQARQRVDRVHGAPIHLSHRHSSLVPKSPPTSDSLEAPSSNVPTTACCLPSRKPPQPARPPPSTGRQVPRCRPCLYAGAMLMAGGFTNAPATVAGPTETSSVSATGAVMHADAAPVAAAPTDTTNNGSCTTTMPTPTSRPPPSSRTRH